MTRLQDKMDKMRNRMDRFTSGGDWFGPSSSGNRAFDDYRSETLKRLEEEQREFKDFLARLRFARDRAEFDRSWPSGAAVLLTRVRNPVRRSNRATDAGAPPSMAGSWRRPSIRDGDDPVALHPPEFKTGPLVPDALRAWIWLPELIFLDKIMNSRYDFSLSEAVSRWVHRRSGAVAV